MERSLSQVAKRKDGEKKQRRKRRRKGTKPTKERRGRKEGTRWEVKFSSVTHQAALVWHRRLKVLMLSQNVIGNGVEFLLGKSST
jgi:hypothetical protein